jgi:hypothetical protein
MALVGIIEGEKLLIKIGNGATPEVFSHSCLINTTRGIAFTTNLSETEVADCTTPSNPAKIVRRAKSIDFTVTGEGTLDKTSAFAFLTWLGTAVAKNVQIYQNETGANGGWVISCPMILQNFQITGARGESQTCQLSLVPTDAYTLAANA